jgi:hypothetical protein
MLIKKKAATECRNFELSVAVDIAKLDFMNKMPFRHSNSR